MLTKEFNLEIDVTRRYMYQTVITNRSITEIPTTKKG